MKNKLKNKKVQLPDNVKIVNLSTISKFGNSMDANFFVNIPDDILNIVGNMTNEEIEKEYNKLKPTIIKIFSFLNKSEIEKGLDEKTINLITDNYGKFGKAILNVNSKGELSIPFSEMSKRKVVLSKMIAFSEAFKKDDVIKKKTEELNKLQNILNQL